MDESDDSQRVGYLDECHFGDMGFCIYMTYVYALCILRDGTHDACMYITTGWSRVMYAYDACMYAWCI